MGGLANMHRTSVCKYTCNGLAGAATLGPA